MSKFWKKINAAPYVLLLSVVLVVVIFLLARQFKTKHTIDKEVAELKKQADSLQKNNNELQGFISYFQTDSYKEKVAREQLSVKKPGEVVYSFSGESGTSTGSGTSGQVLGSTDSANDPASIDQILAASAGVAAKPQSNPVKWWNYFFGIN